MYLSLGVNPPFLGLHRSWVWSRGPEPPTILDGRQVKLVTTFTCRRLEGPVYRRTHPYVLPKSTQTYPTKHNGTKVPVLPLLPFSPFPIPVPWTKGSPGNRTEPVLNLFSGDPDDTSNPVFRLTLDFFP